MRRCAADGAGLLASAAPAASSFHATHACHNLRHGSHCCKIKHNITLTDSAPPLCPAAAAGRTNLHSRHHHWTHSLPNPQPHATCPHRFCLLHHLVQRHAPLLHHTLAMLSRSKHNGASPSHTTPTSQVLLHYVVRLDIPAAERYSNPTPTPKPQILTGSAPPHHRAACRSSGRRPAATPQTRRPP